MKDQKDIKFSQETRDILKKAKIPDNVMEADFKDYDYENLEPNEHVGKIYGNRIRGSIRLALGKLQTRRELTELGKKANSAELP